MSNNESPQKQQFLLGLLIGVTLISFIGLVILAVAFFKTGGSGGDVAGINTNIGNQPSAQGNQPVVAEVQAVRPSVAGVTTYQEKQGASICKEDGKPVVYLFSTTWCPHCQWISATFDATIKEYVDSGKIKAYHWEVDTGNNTLTEAKESQVPPAHMAVYQEFNPQGSIPTFVFGCKYFRIGNGHSRTNDLGAEADEFRALIESLAI